jgi:predicted transcriptional regulator
MNKEYKEIRDNLSIIGLSKTEQDAFFVLMQIQWPQPVSVLAPELEVPRQTANTILRNMSKKGLVIQTNQDGVSHYHTNIKQISEYVDTMCVRLQKAKNYIITS